MKALGDPRGLLQWLGNNRASIKFRDLHEIKTQGPALQELVRQWIAHPKIGVTPA